MANQQSEIDFTRGEQLAILRKVPTSLPDDTGNISKRSIIAVLRSIDEHANGKTGWCWASQETIAAACCISKRTVRRAMAWLDEAGLTAGKQRGNGLTKLTKIVWCNLGELVGVSLPDASGITCQQVAPERASNQEPDRPVETPDRPVETPDRPVVAGISGSNPVLYPVQLSEGVREETSGEVPVVRDRVFELANLIRKACRVGPNTISTDLVWKAAMLGAATDWDPLPVARSIGDGRAGSPRAYLRGAINRARDERGGVTPVLIEEVSSV